MCPYSGWRIDSYCYEQSSSMRNLLLKGLDGWPEHKFPRLIQHRVDTLESALELTREGLCAIYLPRFIAEIHNGFVKERYKLYEQNLNIAFKPVKRDVYILKPTSSKETLEMKKVAKWLRSLA